jgi:glycosyltransferase involved in cell wall biosynthesis
MGFHSNPYKYISKANMFALTSLYEGFANVAVESLACKTCVISTDCKSGPREILSPDSDFQIKTYKPELTPYGILIPNFDGKYKSVSDNLTAEENIWAEVLMELLENNKKRENFALNGFYRAKDFSLEKIYSQWLKILQETANEK